jgi:hypothetical protein
MEQPAFRFTIADAGPLEDYSVQEIASVLEGLGVLLRAFAADAVGRRLSAKGGRALKVIEQASHLRLAGIHASPPVIELLPPRRDQPPPGTLDLDVETVADMAWGAFMSTASDGPGARPERDDAFADFLERISRPSATVLVEDLRPGRERSAAVPVRDAPTYRAATPARMPAVPGDTVEGRLHEANGENHTALLRTTTGDVVKVDFGPEHAEDIRRAWMERTSIRGDVRYDAQTHRVSGVTVSEMMSGDQLAFAFGGVDFWHPPTLADLLSGVEPVADPAELKVHGIPDDEWAGLYEELGLER